MANRFGEDEIIVGLKDKKGNGFPSGYFEFKGQLLKVTLSKANKEGVEAWVSITVKEKKATSFSRGSSSQKSSFGKR